jgi:hypothetical protein
MIAIDEVTLNTFFAALTALILAIIAWYNKQRTTAAVQTATAAVQTASTNAYMAAAIQPAAAQAPQTSGIGFELPRDFSKILNGLDGWYARINPSPQAASLPDEKCWQAVSPKGTFHSGDKDTIIYLITNADADGWRTRNA